MAATRCMNPAGGADSDAVTDPVLPPGPDHAPPPSLPGTAGDSSTASGTPTTAASQSLASPGPASPSTDPSRRSPARWVTIVVGILVLAAAAVVILVVMNNRKADMARDGFHQAYQQVASRVKADTARIQTDVAAADAAATRTDFLDISRAMSDFEATLKAIDFGAHQADGDTLAGDTDRLAQEWHRAADDPTIATSGQLERDGNSWDADARRLAGSLNLKIDNQGNITTAT